MFEPEQDIFDSRATDAAYFVVDRYGMDETQIATKLTDFSANSIALTDDFVCEIKLHFETKNTDGAAVTTSFTARSTTTGITPGWLNQKITLLMAQSKSSRNYGQITRISLQLNTSMQGIEVPQVLFRLSRWEDLEHAEKI